MKASLKKKLEGVWDKLGEIQAVLEEVAGEQAAYADERSEKWHESEAGEASEMALGEMEDAQASMEEVVACIDRIIH
ncbi:MAG: hypothetical protein NVS3B25_33560 [Hymenobacter sp.]